MINKNLLFIAVAALGLAFTGCHKSHRFAVDVPATDSVRIARVDLDLISFDINDQMRKDPGHACACPGSRTGVRWFRHSSYRRLCEMQCCTGTSTPAAKLQNRQHGPPATASRSDE